MLTKINYKGKDYSINLAKGLDISLTLKADETSASAWYCPPIDINPVMTEHFVGSVKAGGAVNFNNISFNPHGNGTHTECVGHISKEFYSINTVLKEYFHFVQLISIAPNKVGDDYIIMQEQLESLFDFESNITGLVIRTKPNSDSKKTTQYTNSNPPYVEAKVMNWLYSKGIRHFLIDTPSVDKEQDDGKLLAHHAFWNYPNAPRLDATITELIYVPNNILDGYYFLNLQVAPFENDASPSRPILFPLLGS